MTTENTTTVVENTETTLAATVEADAPEIVVEGKEPNTQADKTAEATDDEKAKAASDAAKQLNEYKQIKRTRIQELNAKWRESERETARLIKENEQLRATMKVPDPNQYDDNAKYTADTLAHQLDQREIDRNEKQIAQADAARQSAISESWRNRVDDFKSEVADFDAVVYGTLNSKISSDTALMIAEMDDGPQVAYNLGKDLALASRIESLTDRAKAFELGKLAGKLTAPVPRRVTNAPAPINSISGSKAGFREKDPDKMSIDEWMKWDDARMKAKNAG
jgi:DNA repair exonuclease SbcCD ATPase subunit